MPSYRDDIYATLTKQRDKLDRQVPRLVFNFATLARSIPGFLEHFAPIPDNFWASDVTKSGFSVATIACPCGQEPTIEAGRTQQCSGCPRIFFYSGRGVLVGNSPKGAEPVATPVEPDDPFLTA